MNEHIENINHSKIKFEERRSKFILHNSDRKYVDKIHVDKGIYKNNKKNKRCDYAINYDTTTVFIELKGTKIADAIKQIIATDEDSKFTININKKAIIVTRKTPQSDTFLQRGKDNLKKLKIELIHGNSPLEKNFAEIFEI